MSSDIRWIRSYVVVEDDGGLGTVCIYQASSPEKIREHASRVGMPADEITEVADTVVVRPDPVAGSHLSGRARPPWVAPPGAPSMLAAAWTSPTTPRSSTASPSSGAPRPRRGGGSESAPVLYVHGVPTSSDDWLPFLDRTGGLAPDLLGFGRSAKAAERLLAGGARTLRRALPR